MTSTWEKLKACTGPIIDLARIVPAYTNGRARVKCTGVIKRAVSSAHGRGGTATRPHPGETGVSFGEECDASVPACNLGVDGPLNGVTAAPDKKDEERE